MIEEDKPSSSSLAQESDESKESYEEDKRRNWKAENRDPYAAGAETYLARGGLILNPYSDPEDLAEREFWKRGWLDARDDDMAID